MVTTIPKLPLRERLKEISSCVLKYTWFDNHHTINFSLYYIHDFVGFSQERRDTGKDDIRDNMHLPFLLQPNTLRPVGLASSKIGNKLRIVVKI